LSGNTITGGSISVTTPGGGHLIAGVSIKNVDVSGLTVGADGIDMNGHEIGSCNKIAVGTIVGNGGNVTIDSNPTITGTLHCNNKISGYGFNNFADNIDL
jgi:hypothetical protein